MNLRKDHRTIVRQLAGASARAEFSRRANLLEQKLATLNGAAKVDYVALGQVIIEQEALQKESAQLALSEEEYRTLRARHAALLQSLEATCKALVAAQLFAELRDFAALLTELKALDTSSLQGKTAVALCGCAHAKFL